MCLREKGWLETWMRMRPHAFCGLDCLLLVAWQNLIYHIGETRLEEDASLRHKVECVNSTCFTSDISLCLDTKPRRYGNGVKNTVSGDKGRLIIYPTCKKHPRFRTRPPSLRFMHISVSDFVCFQGVSHPLSLSQQFLPPKILPNNIQRSNGREAQVHQVEVRRIMVHWPQTLIHGVPSFLCRWDLSSLPQSSKQRIIGHLAYLYKTSLYLSKRMNHLFWPWNEGAKEEKEDKVA